MILRQAPSVRRRISLRYSARDDNVVECAPREGIRVAPGPSARHRGITVARLPCRAKDRGATFTPSRPFLHIAIPSPAAGFAVGARFQDPFTPPPRTQRHGYELARSSTRCPRAPRYGPAEVAPLRPILKTKGAALSTIREAAPKVPPDLTWAGNAVYFISIFW